MRQKPPRSPRWKRIAVCLVGLLAVGVAVGQGMDDDILPAQARILDVEDVACFHEALTAPFVSNELQVQLDAGALDRIEFGRIWTLPTGGRVCYFRAPSARDATKDVLAYCLRIGSGSSVQSEVWAELVPIVRRKTIMPVGDHLVTLQFLKEATDVSSPGRSNLWGAALAGGDIAGFEVTVSPARVYRLQTHIVRPSGLRLGLVVAADYDASQSIFMNFRVQ
ncbi:MAG: hypothetical protein AAF581_10845 [Planctomycetota bacterium]